jgi:uroporphyrinogen decarboxylase
VTINSPFSVEIAPNWEGLLQCIRRTGTPSRVHFIELFLDQEVQTAICDRFELLDGLGSDDPFYAQKRHISIQRFLGYDHVSCGIEEMELPLHQTTIEDTSTVLRRDRGRTFVEEHIGPITNWAEFEAYPWPDPHAASTRSFEWYQDHLPEDMCIVGYNGVGHFAEYLTWLMGYETLCYALYDQRDLVAAISERLLEIFTVTIRRMLEFDRVKIIWGSDDMGFKTGPLIGPDDLREFVLSGHSVMAQMSHQAGRPYILHSCGNLSTIIEDLIEDVGIDALHSFEDTIVSVIDMKQRYGDRIALLGGIDVDFMSRSTPDQVRRRARHTLESCMPGGGYCLGTGNSVTNYIPVENYLAMLDEGRRFRP